MYRPEQTRAEEMDISQDEGDGCVEVINKEAYALNVNGMLKGEIGICIVEGGIEACGETVEKGNILVSKVEDTCNINLQPNTHLLLFGGEPFPEERYIYWNFVSSDQEKLEWAKKVWANKSFPMMTNDQTYVPLPG